jgi:hypothetical protein
VTAWFFNELAWGERSSGQGIGHVGVNLWTERLEEIERRRGPVPGILVRPSKPGIQADRQKRETKLELGQRVEVVQDGI